MISSFSSLAALEELDRQILRLEEKGYPALSGRSHDEFRRMLEPLRERARDLASASLVLVIPGVKPEDAMPLIEVKGKAGVVNLTPLSSESFQPTLDLPSAPAYLLLDVDSGREWLNVPPAQALPLILAAGRSPMTIGEGIALLTAFPEVLGDKQRHCAYSLAGSRRDDQRVPALWISYKSPRLGWCWNNAPHTWMGTASCAARLF
jgi:hypothetical protein